ncbi:MAG: hypothetical protein PVF57_10320 [Pseudomonadales bacterium]|jgi:ABC-2 type transport system permease protein
MSAFLTLLKREWLEAKAPFLWLPLATLAAIVGLGLLALLVSGTGELHITIRSNGDLPNWLFMNQWSDPEWAVRMEDFRNLVTAPFYVIYVIAALFVLLGSLYDERRDRSILFWKSLPVSDLATVGSKLTLAVWIAPLIFTVCAVAAQLLLLGVFSIYLAGSDLGSIRDLWSHAGLLRGASLLIIGFLIQGLWVLPIAGYLLLVSVSVSRLALLWAVAIPILPAIIESLVFRTRILATGIAKHTEPAALPNFTGDNERIMPDVHGIGDQLALLVNVDLWIGVLIGAALVYAAARLRGLKNEL